MTTLADRLPDEGRRAPFLDLDQRRLILPRHLVSVGLLLFEGGPVSSAPGVASGVAELERAGIVGRGKLHPVARDLLSPIASPQAVISVEIFGSGPPEIATIWCDGRRCTLGVLFGEVVLEDAGGGCPSERSVGSVVIVEVDEPVVGGSALGF